MKTVKIVKIKKITQLSVDNIIQDYIYKIIYTKYSGDFLMIVIFTILIFTSALVFSFCYREKRRFERSRDFYFNILTSLKSGVAVFNSKGEIVFKNENFDNIFMLEYDNISNRLEKFKAQIDTVAEDGVIKIDFNGTDKYILINKKKLYIPDFIDGDIVSVIDVTDREAIKEKFSLSYEIFKNNISGLIVTDINTVILDVNDHFTKITGYDREDVIGKKINVLKSGIHDEQFYKNMWDSIRKTGKWEGEIWNKRKNYDIYPEYLSIFTLYDEAGNPRNYVGSFIDISNIKRYEEKLESIAYYNEVTKLPNKKSFISKLKNFILEHRDKSIAICYLDVDNFKKFMDKYGTEVSNNVIYQISNRMLPHLKSTDIIAHFDEDIFVFATIYNNQKDFEEYLEKIQWAIYRTITVNGENWNFTSSIGVTIYPEDNEIVDELVRHSQQALFNAKMKGRNKISYYDIIMSKQLAIRKEKHQAIEEGLKNNDFILYLQPKYNVVKNIVEGAEVLVRWNHPKLGIIPPGEFIPYIYNSDLEVVFDYYIFDKTIKCIELLRKNGINTKLSINISPKALLNDNLLEHIRRNINNCSKDVINSLEIEIIESTSIDNLEKANSILNEFSKLGFGISVDDFGTGYASLDYIKSLPIDTVKIDRVFVMDMLSDPTDLNITEVVILLAKAFNKNIIAEGVENLETAAALQKLGCEVLQGYVISKPLSIDDFIIYMKHQQGVKLNFPIDSYFTNKEEIEIYAAVNSFKKLVKLENERDRKDFNQNHYDKVYFNSISWLRNRGISFFEKKTIYKNIIDKMVKIREVMDKINKKDIPIDMHSIYLEELNYLVNLMESNFNETWKKDFI